MRRVWIFLLVLFALVFGASALAVGLFVGEGGSVVGAAVGAIIVLGVAAWIIRWTIKRIAAPLGDLIESAERVSAGDYAVRVQPRGPREVRSLARAFNRMAERLESQEQLRRILFADVAHELRGPLMVIRGQAEGMIDGLYPVDRERLQPIVDRTEVMARLLEDLQTLSTAEAGALQLFREPVKPADLVEEAVSAYRVQADAARVALEGRSTRDLPLINVDRVRIGQVFSNLLANAIRHTPEGGSVVVAATADKESVAFEVRDTGTGISSNDLPHVFDRFSHASDSGGAGLGLAIAKSLVEAHGGRISVESAPGEGASVRFAFPRWAGHQAGGPRQRPESI